MRRVRFGRFLIVLGCFGLGCAAAAPAQRPNPRPEVPEVYTIGPEDVLEIAVWQNQDLSRTVTVRPDGMISLPLINDVQAAGLTPEGLKTEIARKLIDFLKGTPELSVIVVEANSRKFYVQGEVRTPGTYPLRSPTTVSQAITLAGGFTEFAKKNKIRVIRRCHGAPEVMEVNYRSIIKAGSPEDDFPLMPGDTILVP
jgi:polysaccharide biosynthesis/export protein